MIGAKTACRWTSGDRKSVLRLGLRQRRRVSRPTRASSVGGRARAAGGVQGLPAALIELFAPAGAVDRTGFQDRRCRQCGPCGWRISTRTPTHDPDQEWLLGDLTDSVDYLWEYAEEHGVADRMVVVMGSDFGRTNFYNSDDGKDHWPIGSFVIMEKNQPWTNRVVSARQTIFTSHTGSIRQRWSATTRTAPSFIRSMSTRHCGVISVLRVRRAHYSFHSTIPRISRSSLAISAEAIKKSPCR